MKYITALFIFLLPIKFATIANVPEMPLWLFNSIFSLDIILTQGFFPVSIFTACSAIILFLSLFKHDKGNNGKSSFTFLIIIILLTLTSFIGIKNGSVNDYIWRQISYLFGVTSLAIAVYIQLKNDPKAKKVFIIAISLGTMISIIYGAYQLFYGFEETRQFYLAMEKKGTVFPGNFRSRVMENRVYSYFGMCNSFAGYLILVMPLLIYSWKSYLKKFKFPKAINNFLIVSVLAFTLFILYHTGSRAALACFAIGLIPFFIKLGKKGAFIGVISTGLITILFFSMGRDLSSFNYRVDYWNSAWTMFTNNIGFGTGWGDFFHDYMTIKGLANPEAPHTPHNLILAFASQVGILGLIASTLFIFYPIYIYLKNIKTQTWLQVTLISGWISWSLHSLSDFNLQIPASISVAIIMGMIYLFLIDRKLPAIKNFPLLQKISFIIIMITTLFFANNIMNQDILLGEMKRLCDPKYKFLDETKSNNNKQIRDLLNKCSENLPLSPFPYINVANYAISKNDIEFAELCILRAIELAPEKGSLYYKLYYIQIRLGNKKDAQLNLRKAQLLFPHKYSHQ